MAEGVDYSRGGPMSPQALINAGKKFAGRYAVNDQSPNGRGITAREYHSMAEAGIDLFLYWEAEESWMGGGYDRGARAAENALANIRRAEMPELMPVYYSEDTGNTSAAWLRAIDDCLRGAASAVGLQRVAFYGGYYHVKHVLETGSARWTCQTYAWSDGLLHPSAHLYQYDNYGNMIGGVDVDLVRSMRANYGQAKLFVPGATTTTTTTTTTAPFPEHRIPAPDVVQAQGHELKENKDQRYVATHGGRFKTAPDRGAPSVGAPYLKGDDRVYTFPWRSTVDGERWFVSRGGSWALAKNFSAE